MEEEERTAMTSTEMNNKDTKLAVFTLDYLSFTITATSQPDRTRTISPQDPRIQ